MFKLEFETLTAAFGVTKADRDHEIEHLLKKVGVQVRSYGRTEGPIYDHNGNRVGNYKLTEDE